MRVVLDAPEVGEPLRTVTLASTYEIAREFGHVVVLDRQPVDRPAIALKIAKDTVAAVVNTASVDVLERIVVPPMMAAL